MNMRLSNLEPDDVTNFEKRPRPSAWNMHIVDDHLISFYAFFV